MNPKGMVMETKGRRVLLLTDEGEFRWQAVPRGRPLPRVGEIIPAPPIARQGFPFAWNYAAAAAVILFLLTCSLWASVSAAPAAMLALDINPSVELYLNGAGRVARVEALNPEGAAVASAGELLGRDPYAAVEAVVSRAISLGYLAAGGENVILTTVVELKPGRSPALDTARLEQAVDIALAAADRTAFVGVEKTGAQVASQARQLGVSVNKLVASQKARSAGLELPIEELRREAVGQAMGKRHINPGLLFKHLGRDGLNPDLPAGDDDHGKDKDKDKDRKDKDKDKDSGKGNYRGNVRRNDRELEREQDHEHNRGDGREEERPRDGKQGEQDERDERAEEEKTPPKHLPGGKAEGTVTRVGVAVGDRPVSLTIETDGREVTYLVAPGVNVELDGEEIPFADLEAGDRVDLRGHGGLVTRIKVRKGSDKDQD